MLYLLHHTIDQSAKSFPEKVAFSYAGETLTYRELMLRANGLAVALINSGIQPGDRVGLLLPKGLEMPVAVFGCLKAGAVIVPLNAQSPANRLALMVKDAAIRSLVVLPEQAQLVETLRKDKGLDIRLVVGLENTSGTSCLDLEWGKLESIEQSPVVRQQEDDPAYLLYTSGSTGQPKGILHSHRSGLAYAKLSAATYEVSSADILGNFAPLHFDQSTFDFYTGPLCAATTVLIPQAFGFVTASLANLIEEEGLSIWYSVPSALIQLVLRDALVGKDLSRLRWVLFGGEPFPPKHLKELMALLPDTRFSNVYGPTEVNQCTYFNFRSDQIIKDALPIGRVWGNTEGLVVDSNDLEVPVGEIGELLIRSPTMMLGYWQRPELNDRAFYHRIRDSGVNDRFFRTGDLVRVRLDGNMEFLGRKDRQIKTRGFRVELDEVEHLLCVHECVEEAATYSVEDSQQGLLIEAAVIATKGTALSQKDLLSHLAQHLPPYAQPRRVHVLKAFPRTRTGKIDRNALSDLVSPVDDN